MTSLEDLKKLTDSSLLKRQDWIDLTTITSKHQNLFRPCLCSHVNKQGSIFFTKDSKTTYSNPNHTAYGLGPVYNRFKCNAIGCNQSFAPVTMLIRFKEQQEALHSKVGTKRAHSPTMESQSPHENFKPFSWNDAIDGIETTQNSLFHTQTVSTPPITTQSTDDSLYVTSLDESSYMTASHSSTNTTSSQSSTNATSNQSSTKATSSQSTNLNTSQPTIDQTTTKNTSQSTNVTTSQNTVDQITYQPITTESQQNQSTQNTSNDINLKFDKLTDIILTMKSDSDKKINFLLDSFDKLLTKNQTLENKIRDLSNRLQNTESNFRNSSNTTNSTLNESSRMTLSSPLNATTSPLESIAKQIETSPNLNANSWASIARSSQENQSKLAKSKAQATIQNTHRAHLLSGLTKFARNQTNQSTITKSVYVGGFEYLKIREIWKALYEARFQTSRIINIQWIGKTVLDIVVISDYHLQFVSELSLNKRFRILTFNPSYNKNAQSPEHSENAMRSFSVRCIKNILNPYNSHICVSHFKLLSEQYCQQNPDLNKIFTEEWNRAKEALSLKIHTIAAKITNASIQLQTKYDESIDKGMKLDQNLLQKLNPEHPALLFVATPQHDPNLIIPTNNETNNAQRDSSLSIPTNNETNNAQPVSNMTIPTNNESDTEIIIDSIITTAASTVEDGSGAH